MTENTSALEKQKQLNEDAPTLRDNNTTHSTLNQSNRSGRLTQQDRSIFDHDLQSVSEILDATEVDLVSLTPHKRRSVYPDFNGTHLYNRGCPKLLKTVSREIGPQFLT